MEKTRTYIDKGEEPRFFTVAPDVHDRVKPSEKKALLDLVAAAEVVVPRGNRAGISELVDTAAEDDQQSLYRVLWLEKDGRPMAVLGFGMVSATDDTYDCFGVAAASPEWAAKGLEALAKWMELAQARMMRFEVDTAHAAVAQSAEPFGYREEGRLEDFYADGVHQLLVFWRPGRKRPARPRES
ncbi:MAG: hypothetical protein QM765_04035 [Myxococcales bacterium]